MDGTRMALERDLGGLGTELSPELVKDTAALLAPLVQRVDAARQHVVRDIAYGDDARHRLDVFAPAQMATAAAGPRPILLYVHGGGFIAGDKGGPDAPHYSNIGAWAVEQGMVGVTMTYRLAPAVKWPAGSDDVGAAVAWLRAHAVDLGGDPRRIVAMGQSAGAVHVAGHVARGGEGLAAAAMLSGLYDIAALRRGRFEDAYYGTDADRMAGMSTLPGLIDSRLPCLFTVSEHDPEAFQQQALLLADRWFAARGRWPRLVYLQGHNHLSPAMGLSAPGDPFATELLSFLTTSLAPRD